MFINYLKIAWRNLLKHKTFTLVNITGLTVAVAAALLLATTALYQLSYDRFNSRLPYLYQLSAETAAGGKVTQTYSQPEPLAPALKSEVPGVADATRYLKDIVTVGLGEQKIDAKAAFVDEALFRMFSFPFVQGTPAGALAQRGNVVLDRRFAEKAFGGQLPAPGARIRVRQDEKWTEYTVSGIVNIPRNSSIQGDIFARFEQHPGYEHAKGKWDNIYHRVYVQLSPASSKAAFEKNALALVHRYYSEKLRTLQRDNAAPAADGELLHLRLLPYSKVHFNDETRSGDNINATYPYMLLLISAFILFIACVNFVNMGMANSFARGREVGMRKVLGAHRLQLLWQFWSEALLVFLVAIVLGTLLAVISLPLYSVMFNNKPDTALLRMPGVPWVLAAVFLLVSLGAGGYPALVMSGFNITAVLKGRLTVGRGRHIGNTLIVAQFAIAVLLIVCTTVAWQQVNFLRKKPLGYNGQQVISLPVGADVEMEPGRLLRLLRNRLANEPAVLGLTGTDNNLGVGRDNRASTAILSTDHKGREITTHLLKVDYDYLETLDIQLVAGRDFSRNYGADSGAIVINESMARQMGEKDPLQAFLEVDGVKHPVIGVVKDFHFKSLHLPIAPLTMFLNSDAINYIFIKVRPDNLPASMAAIKQAWAGLVPGVECKASFLDENTDRQYTTEGLLSKIFISGAVLTIFISCMGLFAIAVLAIARRRKEIGVRKALGASGANIVAMVSGSFLKLVLLAILIASPLAWYLMRQWLQHFAYSIQLNWITFAAAGFAALLVAFLTVSCQSFRAAMTNPVKSLKTE